MHSKTPALNAKVLFGSGFLSAADFRADAFAPGASALGKLGDYEIEDELARGGMGVVYRARDPHLDRRVAIKRLHGAFSAQGIERFLREGRAAAQLQHPHLVTTYHVGHDADGPYLVMELVDGESLERRIERAGPLPVREAAQITERVAAALAHAHGAGVLHRDVKPGNVFLDGDGVPLLGDFGLAKAIDEQGPTVTGQLLGSPSYMAPEQVQGHVLDGRADVYGLGATLYHALTGEPPIRGGSLLETISRIPLEEPTPPARLRPEVDRELEAVCLRCLEKDPERRYPTAEALASDLARYLAGEPVHARPPSPLRRALRWGHRRRERVVAAALVSAVLVAATSLVTARSSADWVEADALMLRAEQLMASEVHGVDPVPLVERALERHDSPLLRRRAAQFYVQIGRYAEARALAEEVIARDPPGYAELALLHDLHLREHPEDAQGFHLTEPLQRLVAAARARGEHNEFTGFVDGELALQAGDLETATRELTRAIDGGKAELTLDRGVAYERLGRLDLARQDYLAAKKADPRHPWPHLNLGALELKQGRAEAAKHHLDVALVLEPGLSPALAARGRARQLLGDIEGATRDFRAAIGSDPRGERYPEAVATAYLEHWRLRALPAGLPFAAWCRALSAGGPRTP